MLCCIQTMLCCYAASKPFDISCAPSLCITNGVLSEIHVFSLKAAPKQQKQQNPGCKIISLTQQQLWAGGCFLFSLHVSFVPSIYSPNLFIHWRVPIHSATVWADAARRSLHNSWWHMQWWLWEIWWLIESFKATLSTSSSAWWQQIMEEQIENVLLVLILEYSSSTEDHILLLQSNDLTRLSALVMLSHCK